MNINVNIIKSAEYDEIMSDDIVCQYILCVSNFQIILHHVLYQYININELTGFFEREDVCVIYNDTLQSYLIDYKIYFTITEEDSQKLSNFLSNEIIKYRFWFPCCYHISHPQYTLLHNRIRHN